MATKNPTPLLPTVDPELPQPPNVEIPAEISLTLDVPTETIIPQTPIKSNLTLDVPTETIIPQGQIKPIYVEVAENGDTIVSKASVLNFAGGTFTVTANGSIADINVVTSGATGNFGFNGNSLYNINGGSFDNGDLSHGATAFLSLPPNGNGNPISLLNYYGNITLTSSLNVGNSFTWIFDKSGNLTLPTNTASINYANGTPYGGSGGGGNGTPGGSNTQVQFNDSNNFGGSANLTFNKNTNTLTTQNIVTTNLYFGGTGAVAIESGNDLNLVSVGLATINVGGTETWTFDNLGNFSAPGNITTSGNISAAGNISGNTAGYTIGYRDIPQITFSANATAALTDAGKHYYSTTVGNLALTLPDNSNVAFPTGATLTVVVNAAGNVLVNQGTGVTLYMAGNSTTGNRIVGAYGLATVMKLAANTWVINGTGVY